MTIYKTRYAAKKAARSDEIVRKVSGGYAIFTWAEWEIFCNQK